MKVTQKIALLKEHAILVGSIPTRKGLDKIKALKRLSEIIVALGGRASNGGETVDDEQSKLDRLTQIALNSDDNSLVTVKLSKVDEVEAKKLKQATGLDLQGYTHEVDNYAIRHTFKQHGNQAQEESRGQVAITEDDIALIPDIIRNYDVVEYADKTKIGRDTIKYSKTYSDTIYYIEEARDGKKGNRLTMQTMYKRKGSVSHTSKTISAQNGTPSAIPLGSNVPPNSPIVNTRQTPLLKDTLSPAFKDLLDGIDDDAVFGIDDLEDLSDSEQQLLLGKTVAFGRAVIAIANIAKALNLEVAFGDFNHTLSQGLFDAVKISPSLFYVVAQVKSLDNIIRLAVSDTGEIIAYVGASGVTLAKRTKVHYSNAKKLQSLIIEAFFKNSQQKG